MQEYGGNINTEYYFCQKKASYKRDGIMTIKKLNDESGYVMVITLCILAVLTISAAAISMLSQTESRIVRNERIYFDNFYEAESAAAKSIDKYKDWNSLVDASPSNGHKFQLETEGESGSKSTVEVVRIEADEEKTAFTNDLSDFATNGVPKMKHIDDPLIDSGTGVTGKTMISRYAVTAEPQDGGVQLQVGIYKYIPNGG